MIKVFATGSSGNCVLIYDLLIDCGINKREFTRIIEQYSPQALLVTHRHGDHIRVYNLTFAHEKGIPIYGGIDLPKLHTVIQPYPSETFYIGGYEIKTHICKHDVPAYGYSITTPDNRRIFYMTDTATMKHIKSSSYDVIMLEHNYDELFYEGHICEDKQCLCRVTIDRHLSVQQARSWIMSHRRDECLVIPLHMSTRHFEIGRVINGNAEYFTIKKGKTG